MRVSRLPDRLFVAIAQQVQLYDTTYKTFELDARRQVRRETYGDDLGQNSWLSEETFEGMQTFLAVVHALADERRLSRHTRFSPLVRPPERSSDAART